MRIRIAMAACLLAACQGGSQPIDNARLPVTDPGGGSLVGAEYDSVCALYVVLPPDENDIPQDPIYCAGTLVGSDILLTAASCVEENLTADTVGDIEVRCGPDFVGADPSDIFAVTDVRLHRYYVRGISRFDLALVRLDGAPAHAIAAVNEAPLTNADLGPSDPAACTGLDVAGCVVLLGYGETANAMENFGTLRGVYTPLRTVEAQQIAAGNAAATTCRGDTGAPVFMDRGSGPVLVAVTSSHRNSCSFTVVRTRVDPFLDQFVYPYLDRFGTSCGLDTTCETSGCPRTPDPDCDPCAWNDTCEENCPTRDWDCDLGSFVGTACVDSGDCEEGGRCVAAVDDAAFTYCSRPCDPAATGDCPSGMSCTDDGNGGNECTWDAPSPGSQGHDCQSGADCRSGICEETYCVVECDPAAADPCPENFANPERPYTCQPSNVQAGTNVCIGEVFSGGGGFCAAGGRGTGWIPWVVVAVPLLLRRRRRAQAARPRR